eukprot:jgi/Astpho2/3447/Aster-x0164
MARPLHVRRGIRLGIAVGIELFIGYVLVAPLGGPSSFAADKFREASMVITAPVVGKLSQQSLEQIVGTLVGGALGLATWEVISIVGLHQQKGLLLSVFLSTATAIVGFGNVVVESFLSDANMTALTYLSVVFAASESPSATSSGQSAFVLAELIFPTATRVGGILVGVLLSLALSVLLWPKSASQEALRHLLHSLQSLQRLNALAWQGSVTGLAAGIGGEAFPEDPHAPPGPSTLMPMQRLGFMSSLRAAVAAMFGQGGRKEEDEEQGLKDALLAPHDCSEDHGGVQGAPAQSCSMRQLHKDVRTVKCHPIFALFLQTDAKAHQLKELQCEAAVLEVYTGLYKMTELMQDSRAEVYIGTVGGRWFFLPGIASWRCSRAWELPSRELNAVAQGVREVARLLRSLYETFAEGFDTETVEMLQQQYPARLVPDLAQAAAKSLQELLADFPNRRSIGSSHLQVFCQYVEALTRISDYQRRRVYRHLRRHRSSSRPRRRHTWSQHQVPQASPFAQAAGPLDGPEEGCGSPQQQGADAAARSSSEGPSSRAWGKAAAALEVVQQPHPARVRLAEAAAAALESSRELHRPRVQFEKVFSLDYLAQDGDVVLQPVPVGPTGEAGPTVM